jgi:hypothetical protein
MKTGVQLSLVLQHVLIAAMRGEACGDDDARADRFRYEV